MCESQSKQDRIKLKTEARGLNYLAKIMSLKVLSEACVQIDTFAFLESLCICFPARVTGSIVLEKALEFIQEYVSKHASMLLHKEEEVRNVPCWIRGDDEICIIEILPNETSHPRPYPLKRKIRVLANGIKNKIT